MGGLGYVDSRSPVLNVKIELDLSTDQSTSQGNLKKKRGGTKSRKQNVVVEAELAQDPTSLRSRKGDTGSVLWRVRLRSSRRMRTDQTERSAASRLQI